MRAVKLSLPVVTLLTAALLIGCGGSGGSPSNTVGNNSTITVDPDLGKSLYPTVLNLSDTQTSATFSAPQLSFSAGRTLRAVNLPAGVSASVDTAQRTLTLKLDTAQASAGTRTVDVQYVEATGRLLLQSPLTLTVTLTPKTPAPNAPVPVPTPTPIPTPAPVPAPTPTPTPADPDLGLTLKVSALSLSSAQPTATFSASNLSFSNGRTLKFTNLPTGVSASVNTASRSATLTLDPAKASTGTTTLGVQYVTSGGAVLLSSSAQLTTTVASTVSGGYRFTLVFAPGTDSRVKSAAQAAAARWEAMITRSIGVKNVTLSAQECGNPTAFNANVQDMVIFVGTEVMDGTDGVLARSGPCLVNSNTLPIAAQLVFDSADVDSLSAQLPSVALHEFGHALGIGSLWRMQGLLQGYGTADPRYTGNSGKREYAALGGTLGTVPVENTGGAGTAYGHWRERSFGTELMTGYLNDGSNPLSRLSLGTLEDLGYSVNYATADSYAASTINSLSTGLHLEDHFERPEIKVLR